MAIVDKTLSLKIYILSPVVKIALIVFKLLLEVRLESVLEILL